MEFINQILQGIKEETEDKPEDKGEFQVYDLRDFDLEKIDLYEFSNSIIIFFNGDNVDELKRFEQDMKPGKYFNFFVVTESRDENSLEQLKTLYPIILDVHGKLGTKYQGSTSTFIEYWNIDGVKSFEVENIDEAIDLLAMIILIRLEGLIVNY